MFGASSDPTLSSTTPRSKTCPVHPALQHPPGAIQQHPGTPGGKSEEGKRQMTMVASGDKERQHQSVQGRAIEKFSCDEVFL